MTADPGDDPADFEPPWEAAADNGPASLVLGAVASVVALLGVSGRLGEGRSAGCAVSRGAASGPATMA